MQIKRLIDWIVKLAIRLSLWSILGILSIMLLSFCGCMACVLVGGTQELLEQRERSHREQALNAKLPDNIEVLFEKRVVYDILPNTNGRYALIPFGDRDGLYDFAAGKYTLLSSDCKGNPPYIQEIWLSNELFLWQDCIFEIETLKSRKIKYLCAYGCTEEEKTEIEQFAQETGEVFFYGTNYFFLIQYIPDAPPLVQAILEDDFVKQIIQEIKKTPIEVFSHYDGRRIQANTERLSPNGQLKASFDGRNLEVKRSVDDIVVAQVNVDKFHQIAEWFVGREQEMIVYGWTDDSRKILLAVKTTFNSGAFVSQVYVFNIP